MKTSIQIIYLLGCITLIGCNNKDNSKLFKQIETLNAELKQENTQLMKQLSTASAKIQLLEQQITKLRETPEAMYEFALQLKQQQKYDQALDVLERLQIKAAGKTIAKKARKEKKIISKFLQKQREELARAERNKFKSVGGGFSVRKVHLKGSFGMTEIVGEMKNSSGNDYLIANFFIGLYDENGDLLGNGVTNISNFRNGTVKNFTGLAQVQEKKVFSYKVQFENAM